MYQRERDPSLHRGLVKCLTRLLILVTITLRLKFATVNNKQAADYTLSV